MEPEQMPTMEGSNGNGAFVGLIVIIVILIIGGIYVWQVKVKNLLNENNNQKITE